MTPLYIGTHNSCAYNFNFSVSFWDKTSGWEWLRILANMFPCLRNKIIALSKTQDKTVAKQLECGANVLDLRVSYSKADNTFYSSHTFACDPFGAILEQIVDHFADHSSVEPIVLLISPDSNNVATFCEHETKLVELVSESLQACISQEKVQIYYKSLSTQNTLIYKGIISLTNIWYNVQTVYEFIHRFRLTNFTDHDILACVLTPSTGCHLFTSLETYARELRPVALGLLFRYARAGNKAPLYCIFDFVDEELIASYKTCFKSALLRPSLVADPVLGKDIWKII